jgi:hypothetical protein
MVVNEKEIQSFYNGIIHLRQYFFNDYQIIINSSDKTARLNALKNLGQNFKVLDGLINKFHTNVINKMGNYIEELVKIADELDDNCQFEMADRIDDIIKESKYGGRILSSRYCPDHRGVSLFKVDEDQFQCPLDGKIYDYNMGFITYDGEVMNGGSVGKQNDGD